MLSSIKIAQLKKFAKAHREIEVLYLFGSTITGKTNGQSDIDLALLLTRKIRREQYFDLRLKFMDQLARLLRTDKVEVIILNEAPLRFYHEIISTGKILYEKNRADRIDQECKMESLYFGMKHYFDFQRETLKMKLG